MEPTPEQTAFMAKNWRDLIRPRTLEIAGMAALTRVAPLLRMLSNSLLSWAPVSTLPST